MSPLTRVMEMTEAVKKELRVTLLTNSKEKKSEKRKKKSEKGTDKAKKVPPINLDDTSARSIEISRSRANANGNIHRKNSGHEGKKEKHSGKRTAEEEEEEELARTYLRIERSELGSDGQLVAATLHSWAKWALMQGAGSEEALCLLTCFRSYETAAHLLLVLQMIVGKVKDSEIAHFCLEWLSKWYKVKPSSFLFTCRIFLTTRSKRLYNIVICCTGRFKRLFEPGSTSPSHSAY